MWKSDRLRRIIMMGSLGKLRATILFSVAFASGLFCQKQSRVVGADVYLRAAAVASPKPVPTPQLTPVQWHEDLRFLSSQLERHHANAFHFISREAFIREVQELDSRLDRLNPDTWHAPHPCHCRRRIAGTSRRLEDSRR